jgi:hypothetical protein
MAIYTLQDIEVTDDGDLVISDFGDIKIASPLRTVAQAIDWVVLTNKGELFSDINFGANIQSFYGSDNAPPTHSLMEMTIADEIKRQGLISMSDFDVDVISTDINSASILIEMKGDFMETEDPDAAYLDLVQEFDGLYRGYEYPFTSGVIKPLSTS